MRHSNSVLDRYCNCYVFRLKVKCRRVFRNASNVDMQLRMLQIDDIFLILMMIIGLSCLFVGLFVI